MIFIIIGIVLIIGYYYFLWSKSYLVITNEKIVKKVRTGLFSKFHMSIAFANIRDVAFSKNHILHYMLGYGSLFARSSAGAVWDFEALAVPHIEKVYKKINFLHQLPNEQRRNIKSFKDHEVSTLPLWEKSEGTLEKKGEETLEQVMEKEKNILLWIQWLKEVIVLSDADRRYIFENEEERNHGVHECLRRQVLFAVTHDSTFRDPDEAIVMQSGKKVIFPVVEFHEIKRKKVSSSSPGMKVHEYLVPKFKKFGEYDATLLIWFDC